MTAPYIVHQWLPTSLLDDPAVNLPYLMAQIMRDILQDQTGQAVEVPSDELTITSTTPVPGTSLASTHSGQRLVRAQWSNCPTTN